MKPRAAICRCADCRAQDRAFPKQGRQLRLLDDRPTKIRRAPRRGAESLA